MRAIIDRFEGDVAVLELQSGGKPEFLDVPRGELPEGARQGDALCGEPDAWEIDADETQARLDHNAELMAKLFKK